MRPNGTPQRKKRARETSLEDATAISTPKRQRLSHSTPEKPSATRSNGSASRRNKTFDDAYDVPDSDEDRHKRKSGSRNQLNGSVSKSPDTRNNQGLNSADPEDEPVKTTPGSRKKSHEAVTTPNGVNGRKKKSQYTDATETNAPHGTRARSEDSEAEESSIHVRSSGRRRTLTAKAQESGPIAKREKAANRSRSGSEVNVTPSAKRQRNVAVPLKGILTPSKRDGERRRKSVAFGSPESSIKAANITFEDLPGKASARKQPSRNGVRSPKIATKTTPRKREITIEEDEKSDEEDKQEEVEEEEEEEEKEKEGEDEEDEEEVDEPCVVCSKTNSRPPNEIVFCDGCDLGYHQKCQDIHKVPEGDWFCNKCVAEKQAKAIASAQLPNFERHLRSLQRVLLDRCMGRRRIKLIEQQEAEDKTRQLLRQTVLEGQGNSMLVIGPRGCGKTTMVESIIEDLRSKHRKDFHVIRLNGFVQTDDKVALKEIWRQLGKEMDVEDENSGKVLSYADTMASLLSLLSHPSETSQDQAEEGMTSQAVVFIIDEFDMFATHSRQTLLYNLFDIAQSRKAPIAVLGCTTRINVVEMLEKRVKSRFSHRYVFLSLPRNFPVYWQICKQGLTVDEEDMEKEGIDTSLKGHEQFYNTWNKMIEEIYEENAFRMILQHHYFTSKSVLGFLSACILPISNLSPTSLNLEIPEKSGAEVKLTPPNSKTHLLPALSELDLGLLIAAGRLDIIAHTDTVNFAMAYDEYSSLMGRQRVQSASSGLMALGGGVRVWGRGVASVAWERLISLGLLSPAGIGGGRSSGTHGGLEGRMWKLEVSLQDISARAKLSQVMARWCKDV